ncbi:hypothetical protein M3J09_010292 [Ascochyta lentis]
MRINMQASHVGVCVVPESPRLACWGPCSVSPISRLHSTTDRGVSPQVFAPCIKAHGQLAVTAQVWTRRPLHGVEVTG